MPISVVIPTYNGQKLLAKNLPSVLKSLQAQDEVIIVDDHSQDSTQSWLLEKFNLKKIALPQIKNKNFKQDAELYSGSNKNLTVKLLINKKNLRFAQTVNQGFFVANNNLVWLLNNDVAPQIEARKFLVKHFEQKNVFAVGCLEIEKNLGGIKGGKNKLWFEKGLFMHSRAKDFKTGETAWASGGSAMFDRNKWLKIGGLDKKYYPAYWEDIDISTSAKKQGWQVLFEEKAVVNHNHESTNKDVFGLKKLEEISWRNANKFTLKQGSFWQKIANLLWRPYWLYQRNKKNKLEIAVFLSILLLATLLRFYKLGEVPHGMTWDEAAIGYNGYAIFTTRRDEWLIRLPVSFKSFGDYKAPLAIYLNALFTYLFGMNLKAVRLPFCLFGIAAVIGIYLLVKILIEFFNLDRKQFKFWPYLAMLALTISPWHLQFSRTGFESGIALTFTIYGFYFFFKMLIITKDKSPNDLLKINCLASLAFINFVASLYTYHSSKIFVPLILVLILISFSKQLKPLIIKILPAGIINLALLYPLVKDSIWGEGMTRAGSLIFNEKLGLIQLVNTILKQFFIHFSPGFLFFGQTDTLRHSPGKWAVLLPGSALLILIGIYSLLKKKVKSKKLFLFLLAWLVIGILPAALATPVPHSNRAILALPAIILILSFILSLVKSKFILITFILLQSWGFLAYLNYYYKDFAALSATDFKDGYLEAMEIAQDYEKGLNNKPKVDKIVFTNDYGQAYIYALFTRKTNPIWYQGGSLIKYEFKDDINVGDLSRHNALVIGSSTDELPTEQADHLVYGSDNEVKFKVFYVK